MEPSALHAIVRETPEWATPLRDPSVAEIEAAVETVRQLHARGAFGVEGDLRFVSVALWEPPKEPTWRLQRAVDQLFTQLPAAVWEPVFALVPPRRLRAIVAIIDRESGSAVPAELYLRRTLSKDNHMHFILEQSTCELDQQPPMMEHEYGLCERLVKNDEGVLQLLEKRGLSREQVQKYLMADPWISFFDGPSRRLVRPMLFYNDYSRPIEGVDVVLDLVKECVLEAQELFACPIPHVDSKTMEPVHDKLSEWESLCNAQASSKGRSDLKPLHITQPEGASFVLNTATRDIYWQKWHMNIGFNSREGLVLRNIRYYDDGVGRGASGRERWRHVLYRASICEMVVPYGDPTWPNPAKNAFDAGEDGLGRNANSLKLGCDCSGLIAYLDGNLIDNEGRVRVIENAICIHEEDYGVILKHTDWRTGQGLSRRSRRLVLSFFTTVANYDYGFFWYFYMDGTIQHEVKLTGQLSTSMMTDQQRAAQRALHQNQSLPPLDNESEGSFKPTHGTPVDGFGSFLTPEGLYAPVHQHFFCARLDWAVDGMRNSVHEVNVHPVHKVQVAQSDEEDEDEVKDAPEFDRASVERLKSANWHKAAFLYSSTMLETEKMARRRVSIENARTWKVVNEHVLNRLQQPVAWKIIPGLNSGAMQHPSSLVSARAGFTRYHIWVTPFEQRELYAAGMYPMQRMKLDGLMEWTKRNRNVKDRDVVMWYSFGVTHVPRPEDWPIMPVEYASFELKPFGFFDVAPCMDVPLTEVADSASRKWKEEECCKAQSKL